MALPAILRRLFKSFGYGPELNDALISRNIFIREWVNSYDYDAGVLVRGSDGLIYMSVTASGPGTSAGVQNPTTAGVSYWVAPKVPTAGSSDNSNLAASTAFVKSAISALSIPAAVPVGCIMYYGAASAPAKWRICNGGAISRTTYADLFAVIGTTYGTGDGSTTFNVPNLIDKFPQGNATPGTVKAAGLPEITGKFSSHVKGIGGTINPNEFGGCFYATVSTKDNWEGATTNRRDNDRTYSVSIKASKSSSVYGKSSTVQPPALTLLPIIKIQAG